MHFTTFVAPDICFYHDPTLLNLDFSARMRRRAAMPVR
jgi:hypothetical protein